MTTISGHSSQSLNELSAFADAEKTPKTTSSSNNNLNALKCGKELTSFINRRVKAQREIPNQPRVHPSIYSDLGGVGSVEDG